MVKKDPLTGDVLTVVDTYPYPLVKGYPTYATDYSMLGMMEDEQKGLVSRTGVDKTINQQLDARTIAQQKKQKVKYDSNGKKIPRPPLSRSASVGELDGVAFRGPNWKKPSSEQLKEYKRGLRISVVYDNTSGYQSSSWTTTNGEFGSTFKTAGFDKRKGMMSFENSRYLPHHPHWVDRPYNNEQILKRTIPTPKSTYQDLGGFYLNDNKLPLDHQYTKIIEASNDPLVL